METPAARATLHIAIFTGATALLLLLEQNPRVLLYSYGITLLYRMIAIWYGATQLNATAFSSMIVRHARLPTQFDRGKPDRDPKTREPAGLGSYIAGILTLLFMIGLVLLMGQGPGFLSIDVLVPEMLFAIMLAGVFFLDDLFGRQLILDPEKAVYQNLGYNTSALNFLLAATFLTAFGFVMVLVIWSMVVETVGRAARWVDWVMLITLSLLKLGYQLRIDFSNPKGFAHLSSLEK